MLGLCWEGGGAKGAFGVKFLYLLKKDYTYLSFNSLAGVSVGGINIIPLIIDDFEFLMTLWKIVKRDGKFIYKKFLKREYETKKFYEFVDLLINRKDFFEKIKNSNKTYLIFSKIKDGKLLIFTNKKLNLYDSECVIIETPEDLKYAILGTSAIPVIFPEVKYKNWILLDGGVEHTFPIKYLMKVSKEEKFLGILHEKPERFFIPNPIKAIFSPFAYLVDKITFEITHKDLEGLNKLDENIYEYEGRKIFLIYPIAPLPSAMDFSSQSLEKSFTIAEKTYSKLKDKLLNFIQVY
ncbi:MAG: patatin-like phospholipase family protein [Caldisericia bacterium]|jgi:predicted patatin/cPLA2 family phospholipase|nr:patatin-like phospholipase family protein [Caldisericia bacterium]